MTIRQALTTDIRQMQMIRSAVRENTLSNPGLVTDRDCEAFINVHGKGWVCEIDSMVVGFSIVDLSTHNVWALFVHPDFERQGIGRRLHDTMLDWYFKQTRENIWLGTSPNTRAEIFYRKAGWTEIGRHGKGEIKFEMTLVDWLKVGKKEGG